MRHNAAATAFDRPPPFFLPQPRRVTNPLKTFRLEMRAFRSRLRERHVVETRDVTRGYVPRSPRALHDAFAILKKGPRRKQAMHNMTEFNTVLTLH